MMLNDRERIQLRLRELQAEFAERGDATGWFDALYKESAGDNTKIPWADLEPNPYFQRWVETAGLKGDGKRALVVGCGLGDDANYLNGLGFKVTAFDISPTAIEWAKNLYPSDEIQFEVGDLFEPANDWIGAFDLVLEIYTIQPLPLEFREKAIAAVASFVAPNGELVVVTRGREDDEDPGTLPWPLSRKELSLFETHDLEQAEFVEMAPEEDGDPRRFLARFIRRQGGG